ncbi:DUF5777 family beta-barrel protein [Algoriphagus boritolerans]|uniref:DUF5777 domain-containing protein n=1 Tax=Algoriphagus boritolerans DSM 17298 = JCM 18970 TaxID=1120964 RepID=A0A1H6A9E6_9BACT|nr:DUF5777 family beta-barrel protein [Algoriphagus boritolerans]SEG44356.1 hypothetical protein SAMN03080598_03954 [Algoriphagus boritolerans DSM 17298 = JCM 18970]
MRTAILTLGLFFTSIGYTHAQLERKLENTNQPVDLIFHAPRHINLLTVEPLEKKTMHFAIMHTFGTLDGGIENLFGLDNGANIQFSFEFGLSDKLSLGAGRSSRDKFYNVYGRYLLLEQTQNNTIPLSMSFAGGAGIVSNPYSFLSADERPDFADRLAYFGQVMFARKFSNKVSLQVSPTLAYFVNPLPIYQIEGNQNLYLALGFSGKYKVTDRSSLTLQYIPNLNSDLRSNFGIGWDVEVGGHVFQMYFVTSQALNEQYLLAGGNGVPGEEFRLGFNVNRIFALGQRKRGKS